MSEHVCYFCDHGPHRSKKCMCGCEQWANTTVIAARATVQTNNIVSDIIPKMNVILVDMLEILAESNPEAVARIDARREEMRKQIEAAQEAQKENANEQELPPAAD
jgi:hypothetical protein